VLFGSRRFLFSAALLARFGGLHLQQALPVGDGDLVVVRVDFASGRKPWRLPPYSTKAACKEGSTRTTLAR
jgi:hypothetical protein